MSCDLKERRHQTCSIPFIRNYTYHHHIMCNIKEEAKIDDEVDNISHEK